MNFKVLFTFWFSVFLLGFNSLFAQRALVFDQYKWNKVERHKYFAGDSIRVKLFTGEKLNGYVSSLQDSVVGISDKMIPLTAIKRIYRNRKGMEVAAGISQYVFIVAGAIPVTNALLNHEDLAHPGVAIPAVASLGAVVITGLISNTRKSYRIRDKNRLRILFWR